MGYNSTLVVLNDGLDFIKDDKDIGAKIRSAVLKLSVSNGPVDIDAGSHVNAMTAIESHHADGLVPVLVGGNYGQVVKNVWIPYISDHAEMYLLKELAHKLGYNVSKSQRRSNYDIKN